MPFKFRTQALDVQLNRWAAVDKTRILFFCKHFESGSSNALEPDSDLCETFCGCVNRSVITDLLGHILARMSELCLQTVSDFCKHSVHFSMVLVWSADIVF